MSMYADLAGTGITLTHKGKTYNLRPITDQMMGEMETGAYQHARELLRADRAEYTQAEYASRLDELRDAFSVGEFSFHGLRGQGYVRTSEGSLKMLCLMLGITDRQEALQVAADCGVELKSLAEALKRESLPDAPPDAPPEGNSKGPG